MVTAANRDGYAAASVSSVIGEAGVSRPTFYEYFEDRDACFLAAVEVAARRLLEATETAVEQRAEGDPTGAVIGALVGFAASEPALARFLMSETLAGGPGTLDARDESVGEIARVLDDANAGLDDATSSPDLCSALLVGACYRLLASRLRRGERALGGLLRELLAWTAYYRRAAGEHRWRTAALTEAAVVVPCSPGGADRLRAPAQPAHAADRRPPANTAACAGWAGAGAAAYT